MWCGPEVFSGITNLHGWRIFVQATLLKVCWVSDLHVVLGGVHRQYATARNWSSLNDLLLFGISVRILSL
jgi:hypothetical protein